MQKVTITGATGFVGKNLIKSLKSNNCIHSLSVRYIPNQIFDFKCNAIIHLAGKAHDLKKVANPQEYYEANFELTKQLYDSFINSNASVFIFMSTVKAVADQVEGVLSEGTPPHPQTHYGIAKQQAEQYILSTDIPSGKRVYILRPCMIHGPGNKGNLNLLYKLVAKGLPWPLGEFNNQRSFLSIENLCFVVKELLKNETIPSGIYQVADDETLSTNELIQTIAESLDKRSFILKVPSFFIKKISRMGDLFGLPLNSERLQKLTENYVVDNHKIVDALGKKLPVKSKQGLLRTFTSFKNKAT